MREGSAGGGASLLPVVLVLVLVPVVVAVLELELVVVLVVAVVAVLYGGPEGHPDPISDTSNIGCRMSDVGPNIRPTIRYLGTKHLLSDVG